jgi:hypothetical protein
MGIPDFDTGFSSYSLPKSGQRTYVKNSSGTVLSSLDTSHAPASRARLNHTSNRRRPIVGTSTPWIPPSGYDRRIQYWDFPFGFTWKWGNYTVEGNLNPTNANLLVQLPGGKQNPIFNGNGVVISTTSEDIVNSIFKAQTKALLDLADEKANMGENLAQAMQTANMFFSAGSDLLRVAVALKHGNLKNILAAGNATSLRKAARSGSIPRRAANRWLEYWYGWRPLALDTIGLFELLQEHLKPALLVHGEGKDSVSYKPGSFERAAPTGFDPMIRVDEQAGYRIKVGLTGRLDDQYSRNMNRIGFINPAGLAWDLIPFSFVVDWVYPIGDVLHALSASAGLRFVGGYSSQVAWRHATFQHTGPSAGSPPASGRIYGFAHKRRVYESFPTPFPYFKSPFTGLPRYATAMALFTQLVTGNRR